MPLHFIFVYTSVSFVNFYFKYQWDLYWKLWVSDLKVVNLIVELENGYLRLYKSMVCCLKLSLYLRVLLLIPSTLTLTCQMFCTNQTNHSLKLFTLLKCWTKTEFPLDTSSARKMIKNF